PRFRRAPMRLPNPTEPSGDQGSPLPSVGNACCRSCLSTITITSFATAYRNRKGERRADTLLTLHPDPSAVKLDKLAAQGEPSPRTLPLLGCRAHLAELLEDFLLILGSDADSGVADRDLHESILRHRPEIDPAPLWRELDRVRQQVQDDLPDLPL